MGSLSATLIAVLASLGAACAFGVGVALQHRQARQEAVRAPVRLLAQLARRRLWLAGVGLAVAAYGLQGLALAFGPLALVAPVIATDLLFALPVAAAWDHRRLRRQDWAGCAVVAGSVTMFLALAPASAGRSTAAAGDWLLASGVVGLICAGAVIAGLLTRPSARASLLALAAGVVMGMTAAVTLSMTRLLRSHGVIAVLGSWQPWVLMALGAAGLLLSASAYQAGALRLSLPIMDTVEPVSGVVIGTAVFGERLASSPAGLSLQLVAALTAVAGIVMLGRSPLATGQHRSSPLRARGQPEEPPLRACGQPEEPPLRACGQPEESPLRAGPGPEESLAAREHALTAREHAPAAELPGPRQPGRHGEHGNSERHASQPAQTQHVPYRVGVIGGHVLVWPQAPRRDDGNDERGHVLVRPAPPGEPWP